MAKELAGVHGNRTHQRHVSMSLDGFEDRGRHQPNTHSRKSDVRGFIVSCEGGDRKASPKSSGRNLLASDNPVHYAGTIRLDVIAFEPQPSRDEGRDRPWTARSPIRAEVS